MDGRFLTFMIFIRRQYYFNLTGMAQENKTAPRWKLLYQATAAYGVSDLSAGNMLSIYRKMVSDVDVFAR